MLPAMKEALESCAGTYEMMKEICAALGDADRGRLGPMSALLSNVQSRHAGRSAEQTLQVLPPALPLLSCQALRQDGCATELRSS